MDLKRKRLKILVDVWGKILEESESITREKVIEYLKKEYEENGIEPFRGAAKPPDIYEKDMISLYLVGIYGLGLKEELNQRIIDIFKPEETYDKASILLIESKDPPESLRSKIVSMLGKEPDSALLSKIFRVEILKHYYGFKEANEMPKLLRSMLNVFPEEIDTVKRLGKFYIAYMISIAISKGEINDWATKEAMKQAFSIELGDLKAIPDDEYILKITKVIYGRENRGLEKILSIKKARKHGRQ